MEQHPFIFKPGLWEGKGTLCFSMAADKMLFDMQWRVEPQQKQSICFSQIVRIPELGQQMCNNFELMITSKERFNIQLTNQLVKNVKGIGMIDGQSIAWEFRQQEEESFEGFEIYSLCSDGSYKMRGEYSTADAIRTIVVGQIYLKSSSSS